MRSLIKLVAVICTTLSFSVVVLTQNVKKIDDFNTRLDAFVERVRSDFQIKTGIAVGVVKNGEVVFQNQYGYLNVEKQIPVKPDTPFYIASSTKSFVGLLAVILAEKGLFKLDEPIATYLPNLSFQNAKIQPDKITIRDLLTHRHGISNEVVSFNTAYSGLRITDNELINAFNESSTFTSNNFDYSNIGYILTGLIIHKTTGKTWQENIKEHLIKPAELRTTSPYISDFEKDSIPSAQYTFIKENRVGQAPLLKNNSTMHAAGGISSNVRDASKWIILHLDKGKYRGKQIFSEQAIEQALRPQAELKSPFFMYQRTSYGLGWYHAKFDKYNMIHSFGNFTAPDRTSLFCPNRRLEFVFLSMKVVAGCSPQI